MYINSLSESQKSEGYRPNSFSSIGSEISGSFLAELSGQMEEWVKAIKDLKITQSEITAISLGESLPDISQDSSEVATEEVVYDSATAALHVSIKINEIANIMTLLFNLIAQENELIKKAAGIFTG